MARKAPRSRERDEIAPARDRSIQRPDLDVLHQQLNKKAPTSALLHLSTQELLPDPACGDLNMLHPIYIRSAKGSRVTDVDGNEYIDLTLGYGPHILGHAPDVVIKAIHDVADRGVQYALHSPYQEPLARLIADAWPGNEMVLFCNSGTEATMHALRVARGFTGKSKIGVFEGDYHGSHDYVLVWTKPDSPAEAPEIVPRRKGIPAETLSTVTMLPYWSDAALEKIRAMRHELAAVMIEPVQGSNQQTTQGAWLKALSQVCRECDVVLIFDEVISGFRLGYGGAQQMFGVTADLVTYGKIVGGGLPAGAIAGRRDIMELFAPRHPNGPAVHSSGTFSGNPLSMATGSAVLSHLRSHPQVYSYLNEQSDRLATELNRFFDDNRLEARVQHAGSIFSVRLRPPAAIRTSRDARSDPALTYAHDAMQLKLFQRGVMIPGLTQFFISAEHTDKDVDDLVDAFGQVVHELRSEGFMPDSSRRAQA